MRSLAQAPARSHTQGSVRPGRDNEAEACWPWGREVSLFKRMESLFFGLSAIFPN